MSCSDSWRLAANFWYSSEAFARGASAARLVCAAASWLFWLSFRAVPMAAMAARSRSSAARNCWMAGSGSWAMVSIVDRRNVSCRLRNRSRLGSASGEISTGSRSEAPRRESAARLSR